MSKFRFLAFVFGVGAFVELFILSTHPSRIKISFFAQPVTQRHTSEKDGSQDYEDFVKGMQRFVDNVNQFMNSTTSSEQNEDFTRSKNGSIHLAVAACGKKIQQAVVMVKSAILFSPGIPLHFIIFTEPGNHQSLKSELLVWQHAKNRSVTFILINPIFPSRNWGRLYRPCATLRLLLPSLLPDVDAVLYVDADTIFLASPSLLWLQFKKFNINHIAAAVQDEKSLGRYRNRSKKLYYGNSGLNSGVMLMNLTRMRSFDWMGKVVSIYNTHRRLISGDQDLINILFHEHDDCVFELPCAFNFVPSHCANTELCEVEEPNTPSGHSKRVVIIHGISEVFSNGKYPIYRNIFVAMLRYSIMSVPDFEVLKLFEFYRNNGPCNITASNN